MSVADRVEYAEVPGADDLFTPDFLDYITAAYDKFAPSIADIRAKREAMIGRAVNDRALPDFPPESEINSGDWQVPPLPKPSCCAPAFAPRDFQGTAGLPA